VFFYVVVGVWTMHRTLYIFMHYRYKLS